MGGRFIEQEHGRLPGKRPGKAHPLLLATGELIGQAVGQMTYAQPLEQTMRFDRSLGGGNILEPERELDGFKGREVRPEGMVLKDNAHATLLRCHGTARFGHHPAADGDRSGIDRHESGNGMEQGGLARSRRAEHGEQLPGSQLQIDGNERFAVGEPNAHPGAHDDGTGHWGTPQDRRSHSSGRATTATTIASTTASAAVTVGSPICW